MDEIVVGGIVVLYSIEWDYHEHLDWDCGVYAIEPYYRVLDSVGVEIEDVEVLLEIKKYEGLC